MLATCFLFSGYAFYLRVDPALLLCTTLSLASFAWALARPRLRRAAVLASHVALAGALLAKGLPALLPTLVPILGVLAWRRDREGLRTWGFSALLLGAVAAAKVGPAPSAGVAALAALVALWPWLRAPRPGAEALLDLVPALVLTGIVGGWLALADARYPVPYLTRAVDDSLNRVGPTLHGDPFLQPPRLYLSRLPGPLLPLVVLPAAGLAGCGPGRAARPARPAAARSALPARGPRPLLCDRLQAEGLPPAALPRRGDSGRVGLRHARSARAA